MKIEFRVDSEATEPRIIVVADRMTDELAELIKRLSAESAQLLAGFKNSEVVLLEQEEIIRVYASEGRVYAETAQGEFQLRLRLYELEQRLSGGRFVRISNSEIVNLGKVKGFDLSLAGTICVSLSNGTVTYVSRRYVSKIKKVLGI